MVSLRLLRAAGAAGLSLFAVSSLSFAFLPSAVVFDDDDEAEEEEAKDEEPKDEWFAVTGGDVHIPGGGVLRGATVLGKNGDIEAIGYELFLPEETKTLDATGYDVYPGFVAYDASSRVFRGSVPRMPLDEAVDQPADVSVEEEEVDPHPFDRLAERMGFGSADEDDDEDFDDEEDEGFFFYDLEEFATASREIGDSFDPFSSDLVLALASGIPTIGQNGIAVKLKRYQLGDVALDQRGIVGFSFGSASSKRALRERLATAAEYLRAYRQWLVEKKSNEELQEPSDKGVHKPTLAVLSGEARAKFSANSREDLLGIARLSNVVELIASGD